MDRLGELLQYKNEHGNKLVPQGFKANPSLAVGKNQRQQYKNNQLSLGRIPKLRVVGL
jgi:hypothetical protein